ncbi:MAG: hypothetical protein Q8K66_10080 [Sediminibacterium sp.]|nr:hypothetical protein [Sediminibacterium sp.]
MVSIIGLVVNITGLYNYINNIEKPYVVDAISLSIVFLLKYGRTRLGLHLATVEDMNMLELAVREKKVPEKDLVEQLVMFINLANNLQNSKDQIYNQELPKTIVEQTILNNPWEQILNKRSHFVLDSDNATIEKFNQKVAFDYHIHTDLLPEPYIGDPLKADIFLLALNPGYAGSEQEYLRQNPALFQALLNNLIHKNIDYPLFYLEERFNDSPGARWWDRILKPILNEVSNNKLLLAHKICELQYFPYHSKSYKSINEILSSQNYTFDLLRSAIKNNKMIIILRSERLWVDAIPELSGNYCKLNSYQNVIISENNLGKADFKRLIDLLSN